MAVVQTPAGAGGAAGVPVAGRYRNPSASPLDKFNAEMPELANCQAPPPRDTKIAQ
jgi:hypothetical protein